MLFFLPLLLCFCIACHAGGPHNEAADGAAPAEHEPDLNDLANDWFAAYNNEVAVTCPCRVEQGGFESQAECMRKLVIGQDTIDCLSAQLMLADSPGLRDTVGCMAEASNTRSPCLSSSACSSAAMNACYELPRECPMFDPQLLTRAFNACPDSILLAR
jgi:hypothetical protein